MSTTEDDTLYVCATCGDIVPHKTIDLSNSIGRCRRCVQEGKTVAWPQLRIESSDFVSLPAPERLHCMALGYLHSAKVLCTELGEHPEALDWPRASVVYFCVHHAAELFLKACILMRSPNETFQHHDVGRLQERYSELFAELKDEFHVETPWDIGLRKAEEEFGTKLNIEDFEYKPDQVYRYMRGKREASPKSVHSFSPGMCLLLSERIEHDIASVWTVVNVKKG
jgi:hypothetical protein